MSFIKMNLIVHELFWQQKEKVDTIDNVNVFSKIKTQFVALKVRVQDNAQTPPHQTPL